MLPFLKRSQEASASAPVDKVTRKPDNEDEQEYDMLEAVMQDLESAFKSGDHKAMAEAFRAAFEVCESYPHHEGPHTNEED